MLGVVSAQETINTSVYVTYDQPFVPKAGSQFGLSASWDRTGILIGNFDVYPNNKVFMGVSFGAKDVINTEDLLFTEQVVAGRLGLRILPWTYVVGTAGNHRYEPPLYNFGYISEELKETIDNLPYKDEFFWGAGVQVRIPYVIFNNFRFVGGISYTNRNTYMFNETNFQNGVYEAAEHLLSSDLTFTLGVTIPLTPYRSQDHQERVEKRQKYKDIRKTNRIKRRGK